MAVLVFIPELDGDAVGGEGEEFFAESTPGEEEGLSDWRKWWKGSVRDALVVLLLLPLLDEKFGYFRGAREEAVPVAPDGVGGVCFGNILGVSTGQEGTLSVLSARETAEIKKVECRLRQGGGILGVPQILRDFDFLVRSLGGEGWREGHRSSRQVGELLGVLTRCCRWGGFEKVKRAGLQSAATFSKYSLLSQLEISAY